MNATINNFYSNVIGAFTKTKMEILGQNFLAPKMLHIIFNSILKHKLKVVETENFYVHYATDTGLNIRIWERNDNLYDVKINNDDIIDEVPECLLESLIDDELEIR